MAQRYFVPDLPGPGPHRLGDELAHHVGTVLRLRPGATLRLADGRGRSALGTVTAVGRRHVDVEVGPAELRPPPPRRVHLAFAPPQKHRAEWLLEHGTEVGVAVFWPVWTERTRPQGDRVGRWQKVVLAAAGQCDRDWLPEVRPALELDELLLRDALPPARLLADARGGALGTVADEVALLVGPEGGFTDAERDRVLAAGFTPLRLGPHVLRAETAALVGAALLMQ